MSWRKETKVGDLADDTEFEIACGCGKHRYEWARELKRQGRLSQVYIDELERALTCLDRHCKVKRVRISVMHDHLNEGFVGGMP